MAGKSQRKHEESSGQHKARKVLRHLKTHPGDEVAFKAAAKLLPAVVAATGCRRPAMASGCHRDDWNAAIAAKSAQMRKTAREHRPHA